MSPLVKSGYGWLLICLSISWLVMSPKPNFSVLKVKQELSRKLNIYFIQICHNFWDNLSLLYLWKFNTTIFSDTIREMTNKSIQPYSSALHTELQLLYILILERTCLVVLVAKHPILYIASLFYYIFFFCFGYFIHFSITGIQGDLYRRRVVVLHVMLKFCTFYARGCHRCPCKDILTLLLRHQLGLY